LEGVERGSADRNEDLEQRIETMKREIDALQVQVVEQAKPWWRQIPVLVTILVSVSALGFSFWTDYKSEDRIGREEEHDARVELRGLVQRLQVIPKENFELYRTYAKDPEAQRTLGSLINTENLVVSRQAAELIEELDGDVSATEYYAVAYAFVFSDQPVEASRLLSEGLKVAQDPLNEAALLRQDAVVRFGLGDQEGARGRFQEALDIFDKYPGQSEVFVAATHLFTETSWAAAELGQGECSEALQHITAGKEYVSQIPPEHTYIGQFQLTETNFNNQCNPPSDT
jgi:hypothetical protein